MIRMQWRAASFHALRFRPSISRLKYRAVVHFTVIVGPARALEIRTQHLSVLYDALTIARLRLVRMSCRISTIQLSLLKDVPVLSGVPVRAGGAAPPRPARHVTSRLRGKQIMGKERGSLPEASSDPRNASFCQASSDRRPIPNSPSPGPAVTAMLGLRKV